MGDDRYEVEGTLGRVLAEVHCVQLSPRVTQLRVVLCGFTAAVQEGFVFLLLQCISILRVITHFNRDDLFPGSTEDQIKENGL